MENDEVNLTAHVMKSHAQTAANSNNVLRHSPTITHKNQKPKTVTHNNEKIALVLALGSVLQYGICFNKKGLP